jgi:acyl carrier protein
MSVLGQLKDMVTPGEPERVSTWAAQYFDGSERTVASGVVQAIIGREGIALERVTPESRLIEDLALNELRLVQLVLAVEEKFAVEVSDQDAAPIHTVRELIACVHKKYAGNAGAGQ